MTFSRVPVGFHPQVSDREEPLFSQPLVRHPGLGRQRPRQMPVALAAQPCENRVVPACSEFQEVADASTRFPPLLEGLGTLEDLGTLLGILGYCFAG